MWLEDGKKYLQLILHFLQQKYKSSNNSIAASPIRTGKQQKKAPQPKKYIYDEEINENKKNKQKEAILRFTRFRREALVN